MSDDTNRVDRRRLLGAVGAGAVAGLAGCGGDDGDGGGDGDGGDGGTTPTRTDAAGGTPTEQGPPERVQPYLDELPDYYPDDYWRIVDGAMDEGSMDMYTATFGAFTEQFVGDFTDLFDFVEVSATTLGTAEVYSRFTTEVSRGQTNPDVLFTYDPVAMRQLYTADLLENYTSPELDNYADRARSSVEGMVQSGHTLNAHAWNPSMFEDANKTPPRRLEGLADAIEDDPDFWEGNLAVYDGITSTSGWQQMDYYSVSLGEDTMRSAYEVLASTDPRGFYSTSTIGGWVANGEVAFAHGMAIWIMSKFILPDFSMDEVAWGDFLMTNIQWPNFQVVSDADNPNAAKLFTDYWISERGQLSLANAWTVVPAYRGLSADDVPVDPYWEVPVHIETIMEEMDYLDSIFMDFEERTTRTAEKSKYKDMWYNIFN